jgi:hypothetical protein
MLATSISGQREYKRINEKKTNPKLSLDFLHHQSLLTSLPAKQIRIKDNRNRG